MIFTYHHIGDKEHDENWVSIRTFRTQLRSLCCSFDIVHIRDYDYHNPRHAVIRFDDGGRDIMRVLPILRHFNIPFSVYIVGEWFGQPGYLGAKDIDEIHRSGGNLQWHTNTHRNLTTIDKPETEFLIPSHILSLGIPGDFISIAYPFWANDDNARECARKYFTNGVSGNGFAVNTVYSLHSIKVKEDTIMSDKIVNYIELVVPTWPCNFRCHYCYVGQHCNELERAAIQKFQYSPRQLATALSIKRLGGRAIVNFCAHGETLILPQNLEYIRAILDAGHFVMVVTNMTQTRAINELLSLPAEQLERLFFKCSFHWLELKRLGLLETFTNNVNNARRAGASITVEITPSDELEPEIPEIREYSMQHFGALPHITVARDENNGYEILTKHTATEYQQIWGQFDSALFDYKMSIWGKPVREFCYAGDWMYSINLATGQINRCSSCGEIGNLFTDKKLPKNPACRNCPFPHCYNGHFWRLFGCLPGENAPTYNDVRDRICSDGTHWVGPRMANAFSTRAWKLNKPYSERKQRRIIRKLHPRHHSFWWHLRHMRF